MKKSPFGLAVILALMAFAAPARAQAQSGAPDNQTAAPATLTSGVCASGHLWAKADSAIGYSTTSTGYVDVPNMAVTFKVPATVPQTCFVVNFSAYSFAAIAGELEFVRATIDGIQVAPGEFQFSGDDDVDADGAWARMATAQWAGLVGPGTHTIKVQFRSFSGQSVFIHKPTMTVSSR